jgi:phosphatidylserine decarboxylase|tara:strand:- start:30533 stop:31084 length:552 start_codon:yes stop_codon:yes gene_type:complete
MSDRLKVLLQYLLPKQHLTTFAGRVAGARGGSMTTRLIRWFVGKYGVDTRMTYIPGTLFSVNPVTARGVPNLFARNERVVCVFQSPDHGPFVMVLVGATIVGSMATVWHGVVNPKRSGRISEWNYADRDIQLKKGEEMGRFLLGSTIVMLFRQGTIAFNENWAPERPVRLGELMGNRTAHKER